MNEAELSACKDRLFGLVRDVRVDAHELGASIDRLREAVDSRAATRDEMERARRQLEACRHTLSRRIEARLGEVRRLLDAAPAVYDATGDGIEQIWNDWDKLRAVCAELASQRLSLDALDAAELAKLSESFHAASERVRELSRLAAWVTIPHRLNHHLEDVPVGRALNLFDVFQDELDREDLARLIERLSVYGGYLNGVIDPRSGLAYSASRQPWKRALSVVQTVVLLALPFVTLVLSARHGGSPILGVPPATAAKVYVGGVGGLLAHVLVNAVKSTQSNAAPTFLDWALWLHVKRVQVAISIVSLWAAFLGVCWLESKPLTTPGLDATGWLPMSLAIGYSLDSIMEVFIQRFDALMNTQLTRWKTSRSEPASASASHPG